MDPTLVGVLGTLGGTLVGAFITWRMQTARQEHEDRTRFHERRVDVYAAFISAANESSLGLQPGRPWPVEAIQKTLREFELMRLICSEGVSQPMDQVHAMLTALMQAAEAGQPTDEPRARYNAAVGILLAAIRKEIGV